MKISIRTKFTIGIVFFFVIIAVLSIFSAYYLNRLSKKTSAILKENHISVIYARDMSDDIMNIYQEITSCYITNTKPDNVLINKNLDLFDKSLHLEKNNITEPGEDKIATGIETAFNEYRDSVVKILKSSKSVDNILYLQNKSGNLDQQLILLSQLNEKAIELKTDDAKVSTKSALKYMTILATLCFLISLTFTYNFASYFNERFYQLYYGIKEIVSNNYGQRLHFEGNDEFYEISLVFNKMAEKLHENKQKIDLTLQSDLEKEPDVNDVLELKSILFRLKNIEEQATDLLTRLENKNI